MGCIVSLSNRTSPSVTPPESNNCKKTKSTSHKADDSNYPLPLPSRPHEQITQSCIVSTTPKPVPSVAASSIRSKSSSINSKGLPKSKHLSHNLISNGLGDKGGRDINEYYEFGNGPILGTGVSGIVTIAVHKKTRIEFALKTLTKKGLKPDKLANLHGEINIMTTLDHPNILRLLEFFETKNEIFLILELCKGGELLDRLHQQAEHRYSERTACKLIYTMLSAVRYCHAHNIVHRDLKLENFLFEDSSPDSNLKLIDFGLSQLYENDEVLHRAVGTPYYVSPEVLSGNYNYKCDIWSIGVIAYMLLSGVPPFYGPDDKATLQSVRQGKWKFNTKLFQPVSTAAKTFITSCLDINASNRPTAASAMKHQWFQLLRSKESPDAVSLDVVSRIRGFTRRTALSRMCMEVVAHCLAASQIANLREEFGKFDMEQTGEISYADMHQVLKRLVSGGELTADEVDNIFSGVNFNETGVIQYHEFIAATVSRNTITEENMRIAFDCIGGEDGVITSSDLYDLLGYEMSNEQVSAVLREIQSLPNKTLDYNQFKRIMLGGLVSPVVQRRIAFFQRERPSQRTAHILQAREVAIREIESRTMTMITSGPILASAADTDAEDEVQKTSSFGLSVVDAHSDTSAPVNNGILPSIIQQQLSPSLLEITKAAALTKTKNDPDIDSGEDSIRPAVLVL